jgi:hypothetical protein
VRLKIEEMDGQIAQALEGVAALREDVDALSKVALELRDEVRVLKLAQQLVKGGKRV